MADDRRRNNSSRNRKDMDREEYLRRKRNLARRSEELGKSKNGARRSIDGSRIPLNDSRRRVDDNSPRRRSSNVYEDRERVRSSRVDTQKKVPKNKIKKKKKKGIFKRVISIILTIILIIIIGGGIRIGTLLGKINSKNMIPPVPVSMDQTVNILLLGMDVGDVKNPSDENLKRTDTIMVLNYNPKTKKVHIVSIPRDTMIEINGRRWKINAAYPIGGETRVVEEVQKLLSVQINYIVKINYKGFRDFIDAIGGVDMKINYDMHYTDKSQNLHINFKKGTTEHLDGKKAEEFFRWRKNNDGTGLPNGDIDRIKNQHAFLEQVVKKCTSPMIIFKLPKILKAFESNIETNMPGTTMLKYGFKMLRLKAGDIVMTTLKGRAQMIGGQSYLVVDKEANGKLIKALNSSDEFVSSLDPSDIKIKILNGTKISGLASTYQIELKQLGFTNVDIGNTELTQKSAIMVDNESIKSTLKSTFKSINNYEKSDSRFSDPNYDVTIVLGSDAKNY